MLEYQSAPAQWRNGQTLGECSRGTVTLECLEIVGHRVHHTAFKALEYGPGPKYYGKNMICDAKKMWYCIFRI